MTAVDRQAVVLYDGDCPLCQRSVRLLGRLDTFGKLHFQSARDTEALPTTFGFRLDTEKLLEEMHVLPPGRDRAFAGFAAFRWMAWRMPLTAVLAPLLYFPGVPWLGNRIYRWVAKNRLQLVPCHDGACRVPLKSKEPR